MPHSDTDRGFWPVNGHGGNSHERWMGGAHAGPTRVNEGTGHTLPWVAVSTGITSSCPHDGPVNPGAHVHVLVACAHLPSSSQSRSVAHVYCLAASAVCGVNVDSASRVRVRVRVRAGMRTGNTVIVMVMVMEPGRELELPTEPVWEPEWRDPWLWTLSASSWFETDEDQERGQCWDDSGTEWKRYTEWWGERNERWRKIYIF